MEISASCKLDRDAIKALTYLSVYKMAVPRQRFILWTIIYSALAALFLFKVLLSPSAVMVTALCVAVVILFSQIYLYALLPGIKYRAMKNLADAENDYLFCEHTLKTTSRSSDYLGSSEMEYSFFAKAYETSKYFFLFQTNNQVYIVDKSTVTGGSFEEIRNRISAYLKDKYYMCRY